MRWETAARAGEYGNGFSVVASEIQQLAKQSNDTAGQIQEMITNLNMNSMHTLERVKQVQDSASISQKNFASLEEIMASIENIYKEISGISERELNI